MSNNESLHVTTEWSENDQRLKSLLSDLSPEEQKRVENYIYGLKMYRFAPKPNKEFVLQAPVIGTEGLEE